MGSNQYLNGIAKLACDMFYFPDLYSSSLIQNKFSNWFLILPFSLICDILGGFYLGTFFIIDFLAFFLWKKNSKLFSLFKSSLFFYLFRYLGLIFIGLNISYAINQIIFILIWELILKKD